MRFSRHLTTPILALSGLVAGCSIAAAPEPGALAVRAESGPLGIRVVYPSEGAVLGLVDSTFLFGTVGDGAARLTVNGEAVRVWPNGSWIAWVPVPDDSVAVFRLEARLDSTMAALTYRVGRRRAVEPTCGACLWLDSTSLAPTGRVVLPEGERIVARVRAAPDAQVRLLLPWGDTVTFVPDGLPAEPAAGVRAFAVDSASAILPPESGRFVAELTPPSSATIMMRGEGSEPPPDVTGVELGGGGDATHGPTTGGLLVDRTEGEPWPLPVLEVVLGRDTVQREWPLRLEPAPDTPVAVRLDDDTAGTGETDGIVNGRAMPGGTYHWFFPTGTVARAEARSGRLLRLRLSERSVAWVSADDVRPLAPNTPVPTATVGSIRVTSEPDRLSLRIPVSTRAPFRVDESDRVLTLRIYGATGDPDWIQLGPRDPLLSLIEWDQTTADEVIVRIHLTQRVWGYRYRWRGRELVLDVRRPPEPDQRAPLSGRTVVLDAGHPPAGSTGPSGQREPDVTLAVGRLARDMLVERGARVIMTRDADTAVALNARTVLAEESAGEVLVSIHTNGLPDGINPFTNSGSSAYYFHPRSLPLARAINRRVVDAFGTRNLGVGRGDLRLIRPSWLPSALIEGLFQMLPEHDGWLATAEGRQRYAQAVVDGLEDFFREVAQHP